MRGDLGQIKGGFPAKLQADILKEEKPYTDRPNAHLAPIDFEKEFPAFQKEFGDRYDRKRFISYKLYPKVFRDFHEFGEEKGVVRTIPTPAFFYGLQPNEEMLIEIEPGKTVTVRYLNITEPTPQGTRVAFFKLNGQTRAVEVLDRSLNIEIIRNKKASEDNEIGAPLQGSLSRILVKVGEEVEVNSPLFIIEAMKMESTITSPIKGKVKAIHLKPKSLVEQDDMVVELE